MDKIDSNYYVKVIMNIRLQVNSGLTNNHFHFGDLMIINESN